MESQSKPVERLVMRSYKSESKHIIEHNRIVCIIPKQKKQIEFYRKNKLKMKINLSNEKKN